MPKIRATFRPWEEIEVSEQESSIHQRRGHVVQTTATTPEGAIRAAERQSETGQEG